MKHRLIVRVFVIFIAASGLALASAAAYKTRAATYDEASEAQKATPDPQYFFLTGIALHENGSPWEGLEVVLFYFDKPGGKIKVGYGLNPETGHVELGNPNAKTDAAGRFVIKVLRGYLEKDAEETEFRIGYLKIARGQAEEVEMGKKGSREPLVLKIKKNVEKLDLGEIW
jgi:hypothetical protein